MGLLGRIDHVNGNGADNRRANLRIATRSQNGANRGPQKNNTSGYKGVSRDKQRWQASITVMGVCHRIGGFDTPEEAAVAYDIRAREVFGEYAKLNLPNAPISLVDRVLKCLIRAKQHKGVSRFYGVYPVNRRWRALIQRDSRRVHIGYFTTEDEAARAVDAELDRQGSPRKRNFPLLSL